MSSPCPTCGQPRPDEPYETTDFRLAAYLAAKGVPEAAPPYRNGRNEMVFVFGPAAHKVATGYATSPEVGYNALVQHYHGLTRRH